MPEQEVIDRAKRDKEEGKSPSTQAGEFVREEMRHIREGKHGAANTKQAIAIGLSKARRAGVELPQPSEGAVHRSPLANRRDATVEKARKEIDKATSRTRSRGVSSALKREGHSTASPANLSRQAKSAARRRGSRARKAPAQRAVRTKGSSGLRRSARKAATSRRRNS
jgi:hypothetical protein